MTYSEKSDIAGLPFFRLPPEKFPLVIRLLSRLTGRELYRVECERPMTKETQSVYVPGREQLGEPVVARIEYADGTVEEV